MGEREIKLQKAKHTDYVLALVEKTKIFSSNYHVYIFQKVCCPSGHPLVPNAFGNSWVCDGADDPNLGACFDALRVPNRTYSSNVQRNRCATCDYDLCAKCHAMKAEQIKNPQPLKALLPTVGNEGERGSHCA